MHRRQRPEAGNGTPVQLTQVGSISRSTRRHTPCRALVGKSPDQELPSSGSLRRSARSSLSGRGLLETRRPYRRPPRQAPDLATSAASHQGRSRPPSSQFRGVPPRSCSQSHVRFFLPHFFLSLFSHVTLLFFALTRQPAGLLG